MTFDAAQRGNFGGTTQQIQVQVNPNPQTVTPTINTVGVITPKGTNYSVYTSPAFSVAAGAYTIVLRGLDPNGGDNTALVDQVLVQATANQTSDPGFTTPALASGAYQYRPSSPAWTFVGSAGLAGNGSDFTSGNPYAPKGAQVAFLQITGSIQQVLNLTAGAYTLAFLAAQRANYGGTTQQIQILVDGNVVGTITPAGTNYAVYSTSPFTVATGIHTIELLGLNPNGGDNTAFIDEVVLGQTFDLR